MKSFIMRYAVFGNVYETVVRTDCSAGAFAWIYGLFPQAENVYCVNEE